MLNQNSRVRWRFDLISWRSGLTRRRRPILLAKIEIGSATIHRIIEQEGPFFEAMQFFPTMTREILDENRGWLQPRFLDARDQLMLCIQSYIVQTPHHTIMIDSCVGNHKPRPTRSFWHMMNSDRYEKDLAASGFSVNDIDFVKSAHAFNDLVTLIPTPGHTIDHYSVQVGKPGADAVITGDMIHSPLQARYPELGMMSDYDSALAGVSRRELFGRFCDTSTLMCTAHFPSPSTARVVRWNDAFEFIDA